MRGSVIVLLVLMAAVSSLSLYQPSNDLRQEYEAYKAKYNKHYGTKEEDNYHMMLYAKSKKTVQELNELYKQGKITWQAGINQFSDMRNDDIPHGWLSDKKDNSAKDPLVFR